MRHGRAAPVAGHRAGPHQERGLSGAAFVGSFPAADFQVRPALPEIAFLGRSNVGKSSLINAIVGRRSLAHVSKTPGKTRTCNVYNIGHQYYLVDLPGYGYAKASHGQRAAFAKLLRDYVTLREPLAGIVWLLDLRHDPSESDRIMAELLDARGVPVLAVLTKEDKVRRGQRAARHGAILAQLGLEEDQSLRTSVTTREGIADLRRSLGRLATGWSDARDKSA